ncbi:Alpha/Beta hydrolase protein [Aspergillus crustosus]
MKKSFVQKVASTFTRSRSSRATAEVSAGTTASVADTSQSTHSAATSRNLRDLSIKLDDYLEQIGLAGDEIDLDVISMSRQIEKVKNYANGSLPPSVEPCSVNDSDLALIKLAAWSAKAVYASDTTQMVRVTRVEDVSEYKPTEHSEDIDASLRDGTVKATRVQLFSSQDEQAPRLLVVAIRGSTSKRRDWTINFDDIGQGTDGDGFINHEDLKYKIHGGFLECAKGMVDKVSQAIASVLSKSGEAKNGTRLLLTGHSAGGAVASLLYAHLVSRNSSSLADLHLRFTSINCITFGSPPVSSPALDSHGDISTFLSIINEGDPVPRMDKDYIESLLIVYLSPMPAVGTTWDLPNMLLEPAGTVLYLKDGVEGLSTVKNDAEQKEVKKVLKTTIFGNPRAHKMDLYLWKLGLVKGLL